MTEALRKNDILASNLYLLGLAISTVALFYYSSQFKPSPHVSQDLWVFTMLCTVVFSIVQVVGIRKGTIWLKVIFVVLTVGGTINYFHSLATHTEPLGKTLVFSSAMILRLVALYLVLKGLFMNRSAVAAEQS